ncbi:hypothetical protein [Marivirga sp.]|uniref:hypothetical protein n=1 Tax=Marivirga sp. TaxID=2018662 RepID=UPI003DA6F01C
MKSVLFINTPIKTVVLTAISFLFMYGQANAQACCSGGVPLGGSLGLGTADAQSIQFLMTYDRNVLRDLMDQRELLVDDTRERMTHSLLNEINYGIGEKWSIATVIPIIRQERKIKNEFSDQTEFTVGQGLGDIMFLIKYSVLSSSLEQKWQWITGVGPKMPTGRSDLRNNNGFTMAADMQPGSGSWDLMLWNFIQKDGFLSPNLSWLLISTYQLNGANDSYNNSQTYQFGNTLQITSGFNFNFFASWPIDAFLFGRFRHQPPDLIDDRPFPGSGGVWASVVPGININISPNLSFRSSVQLPVYRSLEGAQLTTTYRTSFSLFYNLKLNKSKTLKFDEL